MAFVLEPGGSRERHDGRKGRLGMKILPARCRPRREVWREEKRHLDLARVIVELED